MTNSKNRESRQSEKIAKGYYFDSSVFNRKVAISEISFLEPEIVNVLKEEISSSISAIDAQVKDPLPQRVGDSRWLFRAKEKERKLRVFLAALNAKPKSNEAGIAGQVYSFVDTPEVPDSAKDHLGYYWIGSKEGPDCEFMWSYATERMAGDTHWMPACALPIPIDLP